MKTSSKLLETLQLKKFQPLEIKFLKVEIKAMVSFSYYCHLRNILINQGWYIDILGPRIVDNIIIVLSISDLKVLTSDQHNQ